MTLGVLTQPFYLGTQVLGTVPEPFDVAIGGHGYVIEPSKCTRQFISQLRPVGPQVDDVGEAMVNPENLWRRGQVDWSHGAGQVWFDSSQAADRSRFRQSKGMDVWTPFQLSMLRDANTAKKTVTSATPLLLSDPVTGRLWLADGTSLYVTANPSAAAPTWTTVTSGGSTITALVYTGRYVYTAVGGNIVRYDVNDASFTGTLQTVAGRTVSGLAYCNGRLLGWDNTVGALFEIKADGTAVALFTHPQGTGFIWDAGCSAPNAAYIAGHFGWNTEIYRTDVRDATGSLTAPVISATIIGEQVTALLAEAGYVILATKAPDSQGKLRLCQIVNPLYVTGGALQVGPDMFSQLGQRPANPIRCLSTTGRYVYFGWSNLDTVCTGTGRLDLSTFSSPGVPAYATDQMAGTTSATVQGEVTGLVVDPASNQTWMAVSAVGVYGTTGGTSFMRENFLDTGRIRYGLVDPKVLAKLDLHCLPVPASTITVTVTPDSGAIGVTNSYTGGASGPAEPFTLDHQTVEWADLRFTFTDDNAGNSPALTWWKLQGIPVPGSLEQIVLAIIMRDVVRSSASEAGTEEPFDVEAEIAFLSSLVAGRSIVTYQTGSTTEDVYVDNLQQQPDRLGPLTRHLEGLLLVEMRTLSG